MGEMGKWRKQVGRIKSLWAITVLFLLMLGCVLQSGCAAKTDTISNTAGQEDEASVSGWKEAQEEEKKDTIAMREEMMESLKETAESQKTGAKEDLAEVVSGAEAATKGENEEPRHEDLAMDYVILSQSKEHLRTNTPLGQQMFHRPGYQPLCWNTKADGSGENIAFGSRVGSGKNIKSESNVGGEETKSGSNAGSEEETKPDSRIGDEEGTVLYIKWVPETPAESFVWEEREGGIYITGLAEGFADNAVNDKKEVGKAEKTANDEKEAEIAEKTANDEKEAGKAGKSATDANSSKTMLVIPDTLGTLPVRGIATGAFAGSAFESVALPPTLRTIEPGAFSGSALSELWLYDSLTEISDACFEGCENLQTLHIGADTKPRYSTSYFATFADKMDWLKANKDKKKLILAGGSATRFAYNSVWLLQELPDYVPVNMGVYAYANMLPQYRLIEQFAGEGDVLVSAPEFDTTETQFCPSNALDYLFFAMVEADYGNVTLLDLRQYTQVFDSLGVYLAIRGDMPELSYEDSPKHFDDDGNQIPYPTYNQYGDYMLSRPGALEDKMLMYFRADYTVEAFPEKLVESLNRVYRELEEQGVRVFFAYAPRNWSSLTEGSTKEARQALAAYLEEKLAGPVLFDMEESLYPGTLFYLIDSHLCDEGARLYTQMVAQALKKILEPVS